MGPARIPKTGPAVPAATRRQASSLQCLRGSRGALRRQGQRTPAAHQAPCLLLATPGAADRVRQAAMVCGATVHVYCVHGDKQEFEREWKTERSGHDEPENAT